MSTIEGPGEEWTGDDGDDEPVGVYGTVEAFVADYLAPLVVVPGRGRWCPSWTAHPVAVARLTALWRAWEVLRVDPGVGLSQWWVYHCDPHMRSLLDPSGPFHGCRDGHNERTP